MPSDSKNPPFESPKELKQYCVQVARILAVEHGIVLKGRKRYDTICRALWGDDHGKVVAQWGTGKYSKTPRPMGHELAFHIAEAVED